MAQRRRNDNDQHSLFGGALPARPPWHPHPGPACGLSIEAIRAHVAAWNPQWRSYCRQLADSGAGMGFPRPQVEIYAYKACLKLRFARESGWAGEMPKPKEVWTEGFTYPDTWGLPGDPFYEVWLTLEVDNAAAA